MLHVRHAILLCATLVGAPLYAQSTLLTLDGIDPGEGFGTALAGPGDVNGDGVPDLAVGVPKGLSGVLATGSVRVLSGLDGSLIWQVDGPQTGAHFGNRLGSVGDLDGDGVGELLVHPGKPGLLVLSGATGAALLGFGGHPFSGVGLCFAGLDDLDGDGLPEIAIGDPIQSQSIRVYSGATGGLIHGWQTGLGLAVANGGDLDGDGVSDVLASWFDENLVQPGHVKVFSGASKLLLFSIPAPPPAYLFGAALAGGEDLDGDGVPEIAVADPYFDVDRGRVSVFRGSDRSLLHQLTGAADTHLGASLAFTGDLDGDGVADLLCGSVSESMAAGSLGLARVYSGASGALLFERQGSALEGFGSAVAALGDLDGDGADDVAVGWPGATGPNGDAGRVLVFGGPCAAPEPYCTGQLNSQGCSGAMASSGSPSLSSSAALVLRGEQLLPAQAGMLIYSTAGPDALPALGGTLCVQAPFKRTPAVTTTGSGPCGGSLAFDLQAWVLAGNDPQLQPGTDVWAQVWSRDPAAGSGSNLTDGLALSLCP